MFFSTYLLYGTDTPELAAVVSTNGSQNTLDGCVNIPGARVDGSRCLEKIQVYPPIPLDTMNLHLPASQTRHPVTVRYLLM